MSRTNDNALDQTPTTEVQGRRRDIGNDSPAIRGELSSGGTVASATNMELAPVQEAHALQALLNEQRASDVWKDDNPNTVSPTATMVQPEAQYKVITLNEGIGIDAMALRSNEHNAFSDAPGSSITVSTLLHNVRTKVSEKNESKGI